MAEYKNADVKTVKVGDTVFKIFTEEDKKNLKGYQYDSLVYRYIRAREAMAELEWSRDHDFEKSKYYEIARRDIVRFCQILDEVIGERN